MSELTGYLRVIALTHSYISSTVSGAADRIEYLEAVEESLWSEVDDEKALADRLAVALQDAAMFDGNHERRHAVIAAALAAHAEAREVTHD